MIVQYHRSLESLTCDSGAFKEGLRAMPQASIRVWVFIIFRREGGGVEAKP